MKYTFISDEFYEYGSLGGAETCNFELSKRLTQRGHQVDNVLSFFASVDFVLQNNCDAFIIGNFLGLPEEVKLALQTRKYFIYEHDHKYLTSRDPSVFPDYLAPDAYIINRNFYINSYKVVVQSSLHREILCSNLNIKNVEVGLNLWSEEHIRDLSNSLNDKTVEYDAVVMDHIYSQKNTIGALKFCQENGWSVLKIPYGTPHDEFCRKLASAKKFVFFPQVLETLSRVCVEAHCVNTEVVGNTNISYLREDWSSLRGWELLDYLEDRAGRTVNIFES